MYVQKRERQQASAEPPTKRYPHPALTPAPRDTGNHTTRTNPIRNEEAYLWLVFSPSPPIPPPPRFLHPRTEMYITQHVFVCAAHVFVISSSFSAAPTQRTPTGGRGGGTQESKEKNDKNKETPRRTRNGRTIKGQQQPTTTRTTKTRKRRARKNRNKKKTTRTVEL